MGTPFLSELRIFSFNFAPKGWALCNGQLMPIAQNQALFSLLGTTYGGDGRTTFGLPDLRDRVPMHKGGGLTQGERAGETAHTLTMNELPQHVHFAQGTNTAADNVTPTGLVFATTPANAYAKVNPNATPLNPVTVGNVGGSQPHDNNSPYLALNICIALTGVFPSQN